MTYDQWKTESGYLERDECSYRKPEHDDETSEDERLAELERAWARRDVLNDDYLPF